MDRARFAVFSACGRGRADEFPFTGYKEKFGDLALT